MFCNYFIRILNAWTALPNFESSSAIFRQFWKSNSIQSNLFIYIFF